MGNFNQNYKSNQREMFKATCADCGSSCEVPFKPRSDKPIYCSKCFENRSEGGGGERNDRGRDNRRSDRGRDNRRDDREMFKATCAECGSSCEVPFRPSSDKPVYCDSCFGDRGKNNIRRDSDMGGKAISSDQFNILNSKLNAILKSLGAKVVEDKKEEKPDSRKVSKPATKESIAKKTTLKIPAKKTIKKPTVKKSVAKKTSAKKAVKKTTAKKKK